MKVSLWQVKGRHKNPMYPNDKEDYTIAAKDIDTALVKGRRKLGKDYIVYEVEWIATED